MSQLEQYKKISQDRRQTPLMAPLSSSSSYSFTTTTSTTINKIKNTSYKSIHFRCMEGSVTHYYHFFFGALLPLIEYSLNKNIREFRIVTDIGPMKSILCEMPFNIVEILGHSFSCNGNKIHNDMSAYSSLRLGEGDIILPSYDIFNDNLFKDNSITNRMSKRCRQLILQFFKESIPKYISTIPKFKIILIERTVEFYYNQINDDNRSDVYHTSGSQRRCILNHKALADALSNQYGEEFGNVSLERTSIYYQYHLFNSAEIIIAQHGAALANIFFMQSISSHIIEITPPWSRNLYHFKNLASFCNVSYTSINQEGDISNVDIEEVLHQISEIVDLTKSAGSKRQRSIDDDDIDK